MANFNFYLNRQGVRGKKGEKGDQGYSPNIVVKTDTPEEFIMTINNEFDSFDTPNLIPQALSDRVNNMQATLNIHTGQIDTHTTQIDATITELSRVNDEVTVNTNDISALKVDVSTNGKDIITLKDKVSTNTTDISNLRTSVENNTANIDKKQNKLVQGNNITLTDNADGTTTVSSSGGGGAGDVTLAGNNTFTGQNYFKNPDGLNVQGDNNYFRVAKVVENANLPTSDDSSLNNYIQLGDSINVLGGNSYIEVFDSASSRVVASPILSTQSLVAGDNVTLTKDVSGKFITISATGGAATESELDKVLSGTTTDSTTTITAKDGKALELSASMIAVGDNLVNNINGENTQLYLKQGDIEAGSNVAVEKTATGIRINATAGGEVVDTPIATTTTAGKVKPDGTTITVTEDGTISAVGGGSGTLPDNVALIDKRNVFTVPQRIEVSSDSTGLFITKLSPLRSQSYPLTIFNLGSSSALTILSTMGYSGVINDTEIKAGNSSSSKLTLTAGGSSYGKLQLGYDALTYTKSNGDIINLLDTGSSSGETPIATTSTVGTVKPDGNTIAITEDGTISVIGGAGGGSTVADNNGIQGDYATHYGIVDCPNGIIDFNATNKDITVNQGLVLKCAGNGLAKTTISSAITHTLTSTGLITLFYADGNLLECGKVDYSETTPEDNGVANYQAWFNPDKTANPNQQWQFKSNDTGNVFRYVNSATPLADMNISDTGVTSVSYIGYRVIDDDIFAQQSDIESLLGDVQTINTELANTAKVNTDNAFTGTNTFNTGVLYLDQYKEQYIGAMNTNTFAIHTTHPSFVITDGAEMGTSFTFNKENGTIRYLDATGGASSIISSYFLRDTSIKAGSGTAVTKDNSGNVTVGLDSAYIANAAMPSSKYIDLTLGASGATYNAPEAGYLNIYINMDNTNAVNNPYISVIQGGRRFEQRGQGGYLVNETNSMVGRFSFIIPLAKGNFVINHRLPTASSIVLQETRFYYANGSAPTT